MPAEGLYPAVSLNSIGEEVRVILGCSKMVARPFGDDDAMVVDGQDEDWSELSDVQLRGALLEYSGQGKSKTDVGLAQARFPLDTTAHYFEVEIVDPGENCYIAVGLTRKVCMSGMSAPLKIFPRCQVHMELLNACSKII